MVRNSLSLWERAGVRGEASVVKGPGDFLVVRLRLTTRKKNTILLTC
jgi:hypothetical protein